MVGDIRDITMQLEGFTELLHPPGTWEVGLPLPQ